MTTKMPMELRPGDQLIVRDHAIMEGVDTHGSEILGIQHLEFPMPDGRKVPIVRLWLKDHPDHLDLDPLTPAEVAE